MDRTEIREEAHKLKGASGTFGLLQVSELARMLEHSALQIVPSNYRDLLDRIESLLWYGAAMKWKLR